MQKKPNTAYPGYIATVEVPSTNNRVAGYERFKALFLWLPKTIKGERRWLKRAKIRQIALCAAGDVPSKNTYWWNAEWAE